MSLTMAHCSREERCSLCPVIQSVTGLTPVHIRKDLDICGSLKWYCFREVALTPELISTEIVHYMPIPILDELKFFLTADQLHNLSDVLHQRGVQTSDAWERLLYTKFRSHFWRRFRSTNGHGVTNFEASPHRSDPHHVYLTLALRPIIEHLTKDDRKFKIDFKKESEIETRVLCQSCQSKLSSYMKKTTNLKMSWKELCTILKSKNPILKTFQTDMENVVDLMIVNFMAQDTDIVATFLKKLIRRGLKGLKFSRTIPNSIVRELTIFLNTLLVPTKNMITEDFIECTIDRDFDENELIYGSYTGESDSEKNRECKDSDSDSEIDRQSLFDEAVAAPELESDDCPEMVLFSDSEFVTIEESTALQYVKDQIEMKRLEEQGNNKENQNLCLESLSFDFTKNGLKDLLRMKEDGLNLAQSNCNQWPLSPLAVPNLKRLSVNNIGWYDQVFDALVLLGTHQLTHLSLSFKGNNDDCTYPTLMAVLFEYYKDKNCQPLKYLCLETIDLFDQRVELYDYDIYAVERLELKQVYMREPDSLINFFQHNKALTSLKLTSCILEDDNVIRDTPFAVKLLPIVSNISTLETLIIESVFGDYRYELLTESNIEALQQAYLSLLKSRHGLKWLELESCELTDTFVSSPAFLSAIAAHPNLEYLSIRNDNLGSAAMDLLVGLAGSYYSSTLTGLSLENCHTQPRDAFEAAETIYNSWKGRRFLRYLKLAGFKSQLMGTVKRKLSTCVEFLDVLTYNNFSEVADFNEEEVPY